MSFQPFRSATHLVKSNSNVETWWWLNKGVRSHRSTTTTPAVRDANLLRDLIPYPKLCVTIIPTSYLFLFFKSNL